MDFENQLKPAPSPTLIDVLLLFDNLHLEFQLVARLCQKLLRSLRFAKPDCERVLPGANGIRNKLLSMLLSQQAVECAFTIASGCNSNSIPSVSAGNNLMGTSEDPLVLWGEIMTDKEALDVATVENMNY